MEIIFTVLAIISLYIIIKAIKNNKEDKKVVVKESDIIESEKIYYHDDDIVIRIEIQAVKITAEISEMSHYNYFPIRKITYNFSLDEVLEVTKQMDREAATQVAIDIAKSEFKKIILEEQIEKAERLKADVVKLMESNIFDILNTLQTFKPDFTYSLDLKKLYFECSYLQKVNEDYIDFNIEAGPYLIENGYVMIEHKVKGADMIIDAINNIK